MKTIGIIGGMSWESSATYYHLINRDVARRLGGFHSARLVLYSLDFAEIEEYQRREDWARAAAALADAAKGAVAAGAQLLALATNTMHLVASEVEDAAGVPLIHIADATAQAIRSHAEPAGINRVLLLGTRFTMERPFYRERLEEAGIRVTVPTPAERGRIDEIIFTELVHGMVHEASRREYLDIIGRYAAPGYTVPGGGGSAGGGSDGEGAQGVVLGCTEIGLLISQEHLELPVFDTTEIHARALVEAALEA